MGAVEGFLDEQLAHGRMYFSREEALQELSISPAAFSAAATRLIKKRKLINPRHEFFVIQRPEDRLAAPDPVLWIDGLMRHQQLDYRISLLRAAAHHGSSHQASMVFQVIVPKELRAVQVGGRLLEFVFQKEATFRQVNRPDLLQQLKTSEGFAKVAGVELTLIDSTRYYRRAGGIDGVAQIVKDIGGKANPRRLAQLAALYENSTARRLGYLLKISGQERQAQALYSLAEKARSMKPLDPSVIPILSMPAPAYQISERWRLLINAPVEIDS